MKMRDRMSHFSEGFIVVDINLFVLQGPHKPFGFGVIIWIAGTAHTDLDVMFAQDSDVSDRCILDTAIGVMHQAGFDGAI